MPVTLTFDTGNLLRVWRLAGLVTHDQFAEAFEAEIARQGGDDPLSAHADNPVLVVFEEGADLSQLDRAALSRIARDSVESWRPIGGQPDVRGAILCPTAMHQIVGRLFVTEAQNQPDYRVTHRIVATAAEAEAWLGRPLAGIDLPAYAWLPMDDSLAC